MNTPLFGTIDNEIDIMLSLSLNELRQYCQINKHTNQLCKTNMVLNNKFKQINQRIEFLFKILEHKKFQGIWLNTIKEYDDYIIYKTLMNQLNFNDKYNSHVEKNYEDFEITKLQLFMNAHNEYVIEYNISNGYIEEIIYMSVTILQMKEFLLHLYYNNLIF